MPSKLNETYQKYLITLKALESDMKDIKVKIQALEEAGAQSTDEVVKNKLPASSQKKRGALTNIVREVVLAANKPVTTSEIKLAILDQGFKPRGVNFSLTLLKTLQRLKRQGHITGEKTGDSWFFRPSRGTALVVEEAETW